MTHLRRTGKSAIIPVSNCVCGRPGFPPVSRLNGVRAKEDILKRRTFVSGTAALAAAGSGPTGLRRDHQALQLGPQPADRHARQFHRLGQGPRRGSGVPRPALGPLPGAAQEQGHLGRRHHPRLPDDAARGIRRGQSGDPQARLRARLPRHRLRRHHVGPAPAGPHDQRDRRQARREGARDRHRLGRAVGLHRQPDRERLHDRDHQAAGRPHPRRLRQADRQGLHRVPAHQDQGRRRLLRLGRGRARSTRSSSPAASTTCRRRCCSSSRPAA